MFGRMIPQISQWARENPMVEAVFLVGSYARGTPTPQSDLDVMILTPQKLFFLEHTQFAHSFGPVIASQWEDYGPCTSLRVWYQGGEEVEFGLVEPSWLQQPLDPGSREVLRGGYRVLVDKPGYFQDLIL